jgi:MFS family permease
MGIGLVDPILPAISAELDATPAQSMLLFTSYLFITGGMMFFTSFLSSRIGAKTTLLVGLVLIVAFSALAGILRFRRPDHRLPRRLGPGQCALHLHRAVDDRRCRLRRRR